MQIKGAVNDEDIKFTKSQAIAVDELIDFIATPFNEKDCVRCLCGPGGTGKTFVTKYIIEHCKYAVSLIKFATPTHKACRILSQAIGGHNVETIQSLLGLRLNLALEDFDPNRPQFDPMGKNKLMSDDILVKVLFVDEASMLPYKLYNYLVKTCKDKGIKLILLGDASQLPPVGERVSRAFTNNPVLYLREIVRQQQDNPISKILPILRKDIDNLSYRFISYLMVNPVNINEVGEGYEVVNKTKFTELVTEGFSDPAFTSNVDLYKLVAYTNVAVTTWNKFIRQVIVKDANLSIINKHDLFMSRQTVVDDFLSKVIINSEDYIVNEIIDFVDPDYDFKGFMVKFQAVNGGKITAPLFIVNHFDNYTITRYYTVLNSLIETAKSATTGRSNAWKAYYKFKRKYLLATNIIDRYGKIRFEADIDYGFALTAHKSQGSTYDTVFVDVNDMIYDKTGKVYPNADELLRRLYVACSRAKRKLIMCYG